MAKSEAITLDGEVTRVDRGVFEVTLENGHQVECTVSGKLRMNFIKIILGDRVTVEVSPYDLKKGRIVWRYK